MVNHGFTRADTATVSAAVIMQKLNWTDYILKHPNLISSSVVLSDTPAILILSRQYDERRKEHEQKQNTEHYIL